MYRIVRGISKLLFAGMLICCLATALFHRTHLSDATDSHHDESSCQLCGVYQTLGNGLISAGIAIPILILAFGELLRAPFLNPFISPARFAIHSALDPPASI